LPACIVMWLCQDQGTALMDTARKRNTMIEADPAWSQCEHHQQGNTT